ncbi:elongation factor 1-delta-like [Camellia sinensis]|uniref:elongation factor 1-delta-like n=1 Tax=Camellia sinensis TaxID=4442 RepID=UPI0010356D30|nr:elongation factor 1-delta-like [Camellia sinensis]
MAVTFSCVNSQSGLKKLDEYLLARSYMTGYQASKDDITVHTALSKPPSSEYVNASRWYNHIEALLRISGVSGEGCGVTIEGSAPVTEAVATPPVANTKASAAEDEDDDDVDLLVLLVVDTCYTFWIICLLLLDHFDLHLFLFLTSECDFLVILFTAGKSSILMDIKPWDDETDMKKLEEAVRSIQIEGLFWGASKLVPVGYGIKKLQILLSIVDDLVSVDTLIEDTLTAEPVNEYVQSCDIVAFNKI